jgi:hypothetical protein
MAQMDTNMKEMDCLLLFVSICDVCGFFFSL